MSIKSIKIDQSGMAGVTPKVIYIDTTDDVSTVTTAGYLNDAVNKQNFQFAESDMALVTTRVTPSSIAIGVGFYEISKSGDDWSLVSPAAPGEVVLPTIANRIATYTNTTGTLSEDAATAINGGNIQAGLSGTAGELSSFSSVALSGSLVLSAFPNSADFSVTIQNDAHAQSTVYKIPDIGEPAGSFLVSTLNSADININMIAFDVVVTSAALASAGTVDLIAASVTNQYKIRELYLNSGGTNFGTGDRLATISDGTTDYSVIPAANLQALTNETWGATAIPFPASDALNTSTVAGDALTIAYLGFFFHTYLF